MTTQTTWLDLYQKKSFEPLQATTDTDVVIIGAGLTGILTAYQLSTIGKKVIVLEKNNIGEGVTARTTAFLTQSIDTDFVSLISDYGVEKAKLIVNSHGDAIQLIKELVQKYSIDCEFKDCSNITYSTTEKDNKMLQDEYDAAKQLGLNVELNLNPENVTKYLGFEATSILELKNQAKFHPLLFISKMIEVCTQQGVKFYEKTEALNVKKKGQKQIITTPYGEISADWVISATYSPFKEPWSLYFKKGMYVSYVYELETQATHFLEAIYEDTENPYHYFRVDKHEGGSRIVIGGEDHRHDIPVNPTKNFNALKDFSDELLGKTAYTITHQWSGPILEPSDGLPLIGPKSSRNPTMLYAFGFSGNGMTSAGFASIIFKNIIEGKQHPYIDMYSASRFPRFKSLLTKGKDYAGEFFGGAVKNFFAQSKKVKKSNNNK